MRMRIKQDPKGGDVIRFGMDDQTGGTWVCDVPNSFLDATKLSKGSYSPREMLDKLERVANMNEPTTGRYWTAPGEACDIHHIASRAATHLRKHIRVPA